MSTMTAPLISKIIWKTPQLEAVPEYFPDHSSYNHATTNLAIYCNKASKDKLSKAQNMQSSIVIQVREKIHDRLFISTCLFH